MPSVVNELGESSLTHGAAWIWSQALMINHMGNVGSVALIIGVALALCWPGTPEHPRSPPSPRWCQQVYAEQLKLTADLKSPKLHSSLKRKGGKGKERKKKPQHKKPNNFWLSTGQIICGVFGGTSQSIQMEKQLINLMGKRDESGSLQKQCHSSVWVLTGSRSSDRAGLISNGFGGAGKTEVLWQFCEGQRDKNQGFAGWGGSVWLWGCLLGDLNTQENLIPAMYCSDFNTSGWLGLTYKENSLPLCLCLASSPLSLSCQ